MTSLQRLTMPSVIARLKVLTSLFLACDWMRHLTFQIPYFWLDEASDASDSLLVIGWGSWRFRFLTCDWMKHLTLQRPCLWLDEASDASDSLLVIGWGIWRFRFLTSDWMRHLTLQIPYFWLDEASDALDSLLVIGWGIWRFRNLTCDWKRFFAVTRFITAQLCRIVSSSCWPLYFVLCKNEEALCPVFLFIWINVKRNYDVSLSTTIKCNKENRRPYIKKYGVTNSKHLCVYWENSEIKRRK